MIFKKTVFLVAMIGAAFLVGCTEARQANKGSGRGSDLRVWHDSETGCEYLTVGSSFDGQAVTPRMGADGKQICRDKP